MGGIGGREARDTVRLEAFSDGVFAIAITLLVLELHVPHAPGVGLGRQLARQWPSFAALATSFATIGIMWVNHHRLFSLIRRADHVLLVLNGVLLFGVTFVPYPTAVVAGYLNTPGERAAAAFYSATFVCLAIMFNVLWRYASSPARSPRLLGVEPTHPEVLEVHAQYRFGPVGYVAALALAAVSAPASVGLNLLIALFFAFPPHVTVSRRRPPGA